jgi:hypothetical protein
VRDPPLARDLGIDLQRPEQFDAITVGQNVIRAAQTAKYRHGQHRITRHGGRKAPGDRPRERLTQPTARRNLKIEQTGLGTRRPGETDPDQRIRRLGRPRPGHADAA